MQTSGRDGWSVSFKKFEWILRQQKFLRLFSIPDHSVSLERQYFWQQGTNKLTCWQIHLLWQFDVLQFINYSNIAKTTWKIFSMTLQKISSNILRDFWFQNCHESDWKESCSTINLLIIASLEVGFYEARGKAKFSSPLLDCGPLTGILHKKLSGTETTDWQSFDILNQTAKSF